VEQILLEFPAIAAGEEFEPAIARGDQIDPAITSADQLDPLIIAGGPVDPELLPAIVGFEQIDSVSLLAPTAAAVEMIDFGDETYLRDLDDEAVCDDGIVVRQQETREQRNIKKQRTQSI
jgi:hypothetical protein